MTNVAFLPAQVQPQPVQRSAWVEVATNSGVLVLQQALRAAGDGAETGAQAGERIGESAANKPSSQEQPPEVWRCSRCWQRHMAGAQGFSCRSTITVVVDDTPKEAFSSLML